MDPELCPTYKLADTQNPNKSLNPTIWGWPALADSVLI